MQLKYVIINPDDMPRFPYDPVLMESLDMQTQNVIIDEERKVVTIEIKYTGINWREV